jgi:glutaredoxin
MKHLALALIAIVLIANWNRIDRFFDGEPAVIGNHGEVILYATSWCGYCRKTRALFEEQGIAYTEFDIETSDEGRRRYEALNGEGVPVIDIGGTVIHGFDRDEIMAALSQ